MEKFKLESTQTTPDIILSPDERIFSIKGMSAPEDVRALYYPVIEWLEKFCQEIQQGKYNIFNEVNPLTLTIDLNYFNSASAKFLFDILLEFKKIETLGVPLVTEWYYEEDDQDMREADEDISEMVEMELKFITKPANT